MVPAVISAGASLLGGLLGQAAERRNNKYQAQLIREQNAYNAPDQVRARAEAAGFNPLLFVGPGVGQQTATAASSSSNYMGSAIADAGLMLADAVAKRKDVMRLSRMEDQNRRLSEKVQALTLRPQVGGIYSQLEGGVPSLAKSLGVQDAASVSGVGTSSVGGGAAASAVGSLRPLLDVSPEDPRRGVDNAKVKTHAGLIWIDNPWLPFSIPIPTLDGDEALDVFDMPSVVAGASGGIAVGGYKGGNYLSMGGQMDAGYPARVAAAREKAARYKLSQRKPKRRPDAYSNYMTLPHGGPLAGFK